MQNGRNSVLTLVQLSRFGHAYLGQTRQTRQTLLTEIGFTDLLLQIFINDGIAP